MVYEWTYQIVGDETIDWTSIVSTEDKYIMIGNKTGTGGGTFLRHMME